MTPPDQDSRCLFSIEQECQTTVEATDGEIQISGALTRFLKILGRLAKAVRGEPAALRKAPLVLVGTPEDPATARFILADAED